MGHAYAELMFTDAVKAEQTARGSREGYARFAEREAHNDRLGPREIAFLAQRDSFYLASVSETGWPYIQHRGGPRGFLKAIDRHRLAFADFSGNRQYITAGNLRGDDRVSLFVMDYPNRARLKLIGHARVTEADEDPALAAAVAPSDPQARIERIVTISVAAFDWNCPQHITPRFTEEEVMAATAPLRARVEALEAELAALRRAAAP